MEHDVLMKDHKNLQLRYDENNRKLSNTDKFYVDALSLLENQRVHHTDEKKQLVTRIIDIEKNVEKLLIENKNLNEILAMRIDEVKSLSEKLRSTQDYSQMKLNQT